MKKVWDNPRLSTESSVLQDLVFVPAMPRSVSWNCRWRSFTKWWFSVEQEYQDEMRFRVQNILLLCLPRHRPLIGSGKLGSWKVKLTIPHNPYLIWRSYSTPKYFFVKYNEFVPSLQLVSHGVPQRSVLGPIFYLLFTYDLPRTTNAVLATYADGIAEKTRKYF